MKSRVSSVLKFVSCFKNRFDFFGYKLVLHFMFAYNVDCPVVHDCACVERFISVTLLTPVNSCPLVTALAGKLNM